MASLISAKDLQGDGDLLPYSEIFQQLVKKRSEIRTFVFGKTFFSVEILGCAEDEGLIDFRVLHSAVGRVRQIHLPGPLKRKCLTLMRRLGLISAVIEIMVDRDGNHVFTELNQGGQFLWIVQHFPESAVLDAFAEFLISRDPGFEWTAGRASDLTIDSVFNTDVYQELLNEEKEGLCPALPAAARA